MSLGDGSATFEITRAPISPKVEMEDWTVGTSASIPTISGNPKAMVKVSKK